MQGARAAIAERRFDEYCRATREGWARGDLGPQ